MGFTSKIKFMKVIKMIDYSEANSYPEAPLGGMGGFIEKGNRWKDYLNHFTESVHPYAEAFREYVLENEIKMTGESHQYGNEGVPVFDDGTAATFSYRAMGDFMAAVWAEKEDNDYSYMDFYM
jgi:hypothetical protein